MTETFDGYSRDLWINGLRESSEANVRHLLCLFARIGIPKSYLDIGCGDGSLVNVAKALGVEAYGVDQLVDETWSSNFFHHNLVNYFKLPSPVELVTCIEVAEHIHESAHATLCDTICDNLAPGINYLVFSAARPGQGGTGHIACRPAEYWAHEFVLRGLTQHLGLTMNLALLFSNINTPLNYWWDNLMVFERT